MTVVGFMSRTTVFNGHPGDVSKEAARWRSALVSKIPQVEPQASCRAQRVRFPRRRVQRSRAVAQRVGFKKTRMSTHTSRMNSHTSDIWGREGPWLAGRVFVRRKRVVEHSASTFPGDVSKEAARWRSVCLSQETCPKKPRVGAAGIRPSRHAPQGQPKSFVSKNVN